MIRQILHQLDALKQRTGLPWRRLCRSVPYASVMRWRRRQRLAQPLCRPPGLKKSVPPDWAAFYPLLSGLGPGPHRSRGAGKLYEQFAAMLSRRQVAELVQDHRRNQLAAMKHIHWLRTGLAWSCDATAYGPEGQQIIPVLDLCSRYRFQPMVSDRLDGRQIAANLEKLFRLHGAPLFLKRDNGSPFNCQPVDELLARFGVLPLNNPPHCPRYNGAKEKSIRDLKTALDQRLLPAALVRPHLALAVEATVQELNHRPRHCLRGRTACAVYHDPTLRLRRTQRQRQTIFRLLLQQFGAMIGKTVNGHQPRAATLWRLTVESWLRCQGLIVVRQNQNVSTTFTKIWSHN